MPTSASQPEPSQKDSSIFPLKVSANGRYLVDRNGAPFLVHADTGWRMPQRLTLAEVEYYLDNCRALGFNTIHMHAINKEREGPANCAGHLPFDPPEDITRPNEPYWRHLDAILDAATQLRFLLVVSATWFDYGGVGWRRNLTVEAGRAYGRFLGQRCAAHDNIIWVHGGDSTPGGKTDAIRAVTESIHDVAPQHLHTYHAAPEYASAALFADAGWLDINLAYTYQEAYRQVIAEYDRPGRIRPVVLGETGYEDEANTGPRWTPHMVRQQAYWAMLSGAAGTAYGSADIWNFTPAWRAALGKPGRNQMRHVYALFASRPWWTLEPDHRQPLVVGGRGMFWQPDYVTAARAADGGCAMIYLPWPRAVTVDMGRLSGQQVRAWWFSPRDGQTNAADGTPSSAPFAEFAVGGTQTFTSPTQGVEEDWVLVLDDAERQFERPGVTEGRRA